MDGWDTLDGRVGGGVVAEGWGWSDVTGKALAAATHGSVSREEGTLALLSRDQML